MPHIHTLPGQFDHTVEVFIVCDNKVLIRKHDKYDMWLAVGGHIELDEDPNQTALREVKEEVGLDITLFRVRTLPASTDTTTELIPPIFLNKHRISDMHSHVTYTYFASSKTQDVVPERPNDVWCWLTKAEVTSNVVDMPVNIQFYALAALDALST